MKLFIFSNFKNILKGFYQMSNPKTKIINAIDNLIVSTLTETYAAHTLF